MRGFRAWSTRLEIESFGREVVSASVSLRSGHIHFYSHQGPRLFHVCLTLEVSVCFTYCQSDRYKRCRCFHVRVPDFE